MQQRSAWAATVADSDGRPLLRTAAHLHITAMEMATALATARNDSALAEACTAALGRAEEALATKLWHPNLQSYRAWWDDNASTTSVNATMSGSLYGAVWQVTQGLPIGEARASQMRGHLAAERRLNLGRYGLVAGYRLVAEFSTGSAHAEGGSKYPDE